MIAGVNDNLLGDGTQGVRLLLQRVRGLSRWEDVLSAMQCQHNSPLISLFHPIIMIWYSSIGNTVFGTRNSQEVSETRGSRI